MKLSIGMKFFIVLLWLLGANLSFSQTENKSKQESPDTTPPMTLDAETAVKNLIYQAQPAYPSAAQKNHIEGDVVVEILISREGTIARTRSLGGHPYLITAALEAARQYRYRVFRVDGKPVDVITNVTIHFPPPKAAPKVRATSKKS
ncbi:MAG: energy transducer TonB [Acidobacteriia bacterium]|nr:energy transducer TonB [Terriglobia bacterium]